MKKVQTCADIARRDREMAEADTSGRSEEKSEKQTKFPAFHAAQTEDIFEESGKAEQQPVNQQEKKPEKKTSLLRKLDEKKKECAVRDAKQQAVKKKRNHETDYKSKPDRPCLFFERTGRTVGEKWQRIPLEKA